MRRELCAGVTLLAGVLMLLAARPTPSQEREAGKTVQLTVLLPMEDAKLTVAGTEVKGTGLKRTVSVAAGEKPVTVSAFWEPNNYTKITRKRSVDVSKGAALVDLRAQDLREPDDIVVRYVPTPNDVVDAMCTMGRVGKNDIVYDLGCGDGRMVITAVKKFGAKRGVGVDLDPDRIKDSKMNAEKEGVSDKLEFRVGDVLKIDDLSSATVVLLYMGDDINLRLRPILQKTLKPGARIVSHRFTMGDWQPVRRQTVDSKAGYPCTVLLWEIPAEKK